MYQDAPRQASMIIRDRISSNESIDRGFWGVYLLTQNVFMFNVFLWLQPVSLSVVQ